MIDFSKERPSEVWVIGPIAPQENVDTIAIRKYQVAYSGFLPIVYLCSDASDPSSYLEFPLDGKALAMGCIAPFAGKLRNCYQTKALAFAEAQKIIGIRAGILNLLRGSGYFLGAYLFASDNPSENNNNDDIWFSGDLPIYAITNPQRKAEAMRAFGALDGKPAPERTEEGR